MNVLRKLLLIVLVGFGIVSFSSADMRYYAWTYQFITMPPGDTEIEFYTTLYHPDFNEPDDSKWKQQIEIETGLTDRWDISFYQVYEYKPSNGSRKLKEFKIRTRFKLVAEKGEFIVDPLLYLEYKLQADITYPNKWEAKLIIAKDIGDLNIAVNIIPEESYRSGTKEKYWKTEYAVGVSYPVVLNLLRVGIEAKGDLTNDKHLLGPVISFEGRGIWAAISPIFGLNSKSDNLRFQAIVGIIL